MIYNIKKILFIIKNQKNTAFLFVINDIKNSFFDHYLTKKSHFNEFLG